MKFGKIHRPLFIFCLSISIGLHFAFLYFIYCHPFVFENMKNNSILKPSSMLTLNEEPDVIIERMEKALEESFHSLITLTKSQEEPSQAIAGASSKPEDSTSDKMVSPVSAQDLHLPFLQQKEAFASLSPTFDPDFESSLAEFALEDELEEDFPYYQADPTASIAATELSFSPPQPTAFIEEAKAEEEHNFTPEKLELEHAFKLLSSFQTLSASQKAITQPLFSNLEESTTPKLILPNAVDYLRNQWVKKNPVEHVLPDPEYYGIEALCSNLKWEEEIDIDVSFMPCTDGTKYVFSLTMHPSFENEVEPMAQNFYFLIDRSSSIEKQKFHRFKRSVQRALAALKEGDRFNIYIFDKKVVKLSEQTILVTPKTIHMAEEFLESQEAKTHFAATEVYTSLEKMLPTTFEEKQLHSIILITDGNTLLSSKQQKAVLEGWNKKFDGNVNIYTAAAGKGNNLVMLDLLSYLTAGKLLYSDTNAGLPRKLVQMVKNLHQPILKNITVELSANVNTAKVHLHPHNQLLAPMFAGQEYVLVGTVDELCDITVFVQGKNHDKWVNLRKTISLKNALPSTRTLEKLWADAQSKVCYEIFLKNGKNTHLKEAKQIVAPYRAAIASEQ